MLLRISLVSTSSGISVAAAVSIVLCPILVVSLLVASIVMITTLLQVWKRSKTEELYLTSNYIGSCIYAEHCISQLGQIKEHR